MAVFCNVAPGCRSVWYRPPHEPLALPGPQLGPCHLSTDRMNTR